MTTQKLSKLTPEQKRTLIAKLCPRIWKREDEVWFCGGCMSNVLDDLNAMHEVENWLRTQGTLWIDYECQIGKCDTAAQRADVFLQTLCKQHSQLK